MRERSHAGFAQIADKFVVLAPTSSCRNGRRAPVVPRGAVRHRVRPHGLEVRHESAHSILLEVQTALCEDAAFPTREVAVEEDGEEGRRQQEGRQGQPQEPSQPGRNQQSPHHPKPQRPRPAFRKSRIPGRPGLWARQSRLPEALRTAGGLVEAEASSFAVLIRLTTS
ncbi:hypothetical protein PHYPSEUDO_014244 [Phytophthora pseudosyringae]|uniref:Uncharacterized protein n=1 Tax=Phytophthora pseudosyringae TaxID=221518 RepID=A0A8T1WG10_9STRA|nr:hypothetical protein PHYPSEUDO_014244 [Phytophthora pseudosyringae]